MIRETGKISISRAKRGNGGRCREGQVIALSQIVEEEERSVFNDGPTNRTAKLMYLLDGFCERRQIGYASRNCIRSVPFQLRVVSVECGVLTVVITRAVKLIGTGLDRSIDDCACSTAYFGWWDTCRYLEFSDRIRIWEYTNGAKLWLVVVDPV